MTSFSLIEETLKPFLAVVLQQYKDFQMQEVPSDSKSFTSYHSAGKAALSHLQLLLQFMQTEKSTDSELESLKAEAKSAFMALEVTDDG